jgi:hypothetical protein
MLEEECIVPKATDDTYLQKLHKAHTGKHPSYGKPSAKLKVRSIHTGQSFWYLCWKNSFLLLNIV